jgi:xanthine dehydrogenase accessory factor
MTHSWVERIAGFLDQGHAVCRVVVAEVKGSAPREAGAELYVTPTQIFDTIGGGALEYEAIHLARKQLAEMGEGRFFRQFRSFALGPNLGQCCGGQVVLLFEGFSLAVKDKLEQITLEGMHSFMHQMAGNIICQPMPDKVSQPVYDAQKKTLKMPLQRPSMPLYLYGAGHVGRAVIQAVASLNLDIIWVDTDISRFPDNIDTAITRVPAKDMHIIASHALPDSIHLVMTYSHRLDEEIVYTILKNKNFSHIGLIGSQTKYRRFRSLLSKRGISDALLDQLNCPIGIPEITAKTPAHVALSIAAQIAIWLEAKDISKK